jgi:hypothetical protein
VLGDHRMRYLPAVLILTLLAGCDNVQWGGAEVAVVPPPPRGGAATGQAVGTDGERLPEGPILYHVMPAGNGGVMVPVGEVSGDSMVPMRATSDWNLYGSRFIAEFLRQGSEFALFHNGARVGTFVVQGASVPDVTVCPRLPRATGTLELSPGAEQMTEFLALSKAQAPDVRRRLGPDLQATRSMQVIGPILAERMLRARRQQLPGNWQRAMAQIKPFPLSGTADPGFSATLLVDDTLGVGLDNQGYSLFFVALPQGGVGYDTAFVHFTNYPTDGKAAARTVDYLDWNRDDQVDLLLQVYGGTSTWFEAVSKTRLGWRRIFQDKCQVQPSAAPAAAVPAGEQEARPAPRPGVRQQPVQSDAPGTAADRRVPQILGEPLPDSTR